MRSKPRMRPRTSIAVAALLAGGCASAAPSHRADADAEVAHRVGALPRAWVRSKTAGGELAYTHAQGGTIYTDHFCLGELRDLSLNVLTNQLLFDVKVIHRTQRLITVAGREALRTRVSGELDGVPIELDVVVLKKDGCTYDLVLVSGPNIFPQRELDFEAFVRGFERVG
jgi:hypothetical protein